MHTYTDTILRIQETLPREVAEKMHAPPQDESIPFATADTMKEYDTFLFGIPTREFLPKH